MKNVAMQTIPISQGKNYFNYSQSTNNVGNNATKISHNLLKKKINQLHESNNLRLEQQLEKLHQSKKNAMH